MRIVVAAASTDLRLALELRLSEEPAVEIVGSAGEGGALIALVSASLPDLVITEWPLPVVPSDELLPALKRNSPPPKLLIIGDSEHLDNALRAGADAVTAIGAPPEQLLHTFQELIQSESPETTQ